MSATNTPNQGFPLAQYGDPPTAIGTTTFPALAAAADGKATQLDADQARAATPNMVKISCSLGYVSANDPAQVGMQYDTVEFNRGTPTDLTVLNGLQFNRGLWMVGFECTLKPFSGYGNGQDLIQSIRISNGPNDPLSGIGYVRMDVCTTIQVIGMTQVFTPPVWGPPYQYLNACTVVYAATDGFQVTSTSFAGGRSDVPYATLWAVQIGDQ